MMSLEISHAEFVRLSRRRHGERYSYHQDHHHKPCVTCRKHGPLKVTPQRHLLGDGCQRCMACSPVCEPAR